MAAAFVASSKNVLYITMEMSEEVTALRIDANLLDTPIGSIKHMKKDQYVSRVGKVRAKCNGQLVIKEYPTSGAHVGHFKALLNELKLKKKFVPDVIFIDYLNICASQRVKGGNANSYTIVKSIAEEMRGMAVEFDVPIVSATQAVRGANGASDLSMTDVSESMGLASTVDMLLGIIRTPELDAQNQLLFKLLKSRFVDAAIHPPFLVGVDRSKMKLYDLDSQRLPAAGAPPRFDKNKPSVPDIGSSLKSVRSKEFDDFVFDD
jgi:replicative DNA helicase